MPDVGWPLLFIVLGLIGVVIMAVTQPQVLFAREPATAEGISEVERAMIRGAVQAGKGKTESLQALKGYSGRRHRAYSAAWEEARAELVSQGALVL